MKKTEWALTFPHPEDYWLTMMDAKGYVTGVKLHWADRTYLLNVYDPVRLAQDLAGSIASDGFEVLSNVIVVSELTRENLEQALGVILPSPRAALLKCE